jgi:RNA polymerase sigma factor (sigma-70 family)
MVETDWLTERFEASRPRLLAVAYRMLGSHAEADDAVQETWLRLDRADADAVENLGAWLTTVIARVCLDRLRARRSRREDPVGDDLPEEIVGVADEVDPEHQALLAESIGSALLVVLDMLAPTERVAFVLHNIFAVPFDEIGPIVGRSPTRLDRSPVVLGAVCGAPLALPTLISFPGGGWSTPSSPPPARATSTPCWACSIPMLWSAQMPPHCRWEERG